MATPIANATVQKDMILIGLGSSLPFWGRSPEAVLPCAVHALSRLGKVAAVSRIYESPAWPDRSDPVFFNACVGLRTGLAPNALLAGLLAVESGFGRRRERRNGPRTLDLDLLDYQGLMRCDAGPPGLQLPHPRLIDRDFVLLPLRDIAPDWRDPASGRTVSTLIAALGSLAAKPVAALGAI